MNLKEKSTSASPSEKEVKSVEEKFIKRLEKLVDRSKNPRNSGRKASLKRSVGKSISESKDVYWFYSLIKNEEDRKFIDLYFLVGTLMCQSRDIRIARGISCKNFGGTVKEVKKQKDSDSIDKRFRILLDSEFEQGYSGEMAYRLRQMVKLADSSEIGINWVQLLQDLKDWWYSSKTVQKRWAKTYFINFPEKSDS